MKLLTRRGVLVEEQGQTYVADSDGDSDEARTLRPLQAAAWPCRLGLPHRLRPTRRPEGADAAGCDAQGRGLLADALRRHPGQQRSTPPCASAPTCRQALEPLCRYITRPALANERVQTNAAGQVVLKLKTAWRDGTTRLLSLEFMQRLAVLVPRPGLGCDKTWVQISLR